MCAAVWMRQACRENTGKLSQYDLILSCGDLKAEYLSFLVTMARCPLLYVHGNHDDDYIRREPEGCDCIDDKLVVYKGLRILGLGGSRRYSGGTRECDLLSESRRGAATDGQHSKSKRST